jgi:predicted nucleotidyltransferase component of viral defense system
VIPRAHITAWRSRAPWATDAQVEQDLVLSRALVALFQQPLLCRSLLFRGGTALHKVVLPPAARYSEDLDLVQAEAGPIGSVMGAVRAALDHWLGKPRTERSAASVRLTYRFQSEGPPMTPLRLKIEINTREHLHVLPLEAREFVVETAWFTGRAHVPVYAIEELLGTKLRALYQRRKGRDLFDVADALARAPGIRPEEVTRCFGAYLAEAGARVSRADFEANLASKLEDHRFAGDIPPLLTSEARERYDPFAAGELVSRLLLPNLPAS